MRCSSLHTRGAMCDDMRDEGLVFLLVQYPATATQQAGRQAAAGGVQLGRYSHTHLWRAWHKVWLPPAHGQQPDVEWVEPVHVLLQADGLQDALLVHVLGQGQLHQDAVHRGIGVVVLDHLAGGYGAGEGSCSPGPPDKENRGVGGGLRNRPGPPDRGGGGPGPTT